VCCCLGQISKFNQIEILSSACCDCDGFKKGKYVSTEGIARAIRFAINDIESNFEFQIKSAYINIMGKFVEIYSTRYGITLKDKYDGVTQNDIDSIIEGVAQVQIPEEYQIIDIVPIRFITDTKATKDPIGAYTKTLSADIDVILAKKEVIQDISLIMQKAGLEIDGIIVNGFTLKDLVLEKDEKQNGVILLDVQSENMDISVFKDDGILYSDSLPIGGDTITNDIAESFDISIEEAKKLKKQYGLADVTYIDHDYNIKLNSHKGEDSIIKCSELVSVIAARTNEVFGIIIDTLKENKLTDKINSMVITGQGFVNINKIDKVAEKLFRIPVKFGAPKVANVVKPDYLTAYGEVKYISSIKHNKNIGSTISFDEEQSFVDTALKNIKKLFGKRASKIN
jgi:cell division protein FtsA